MQVHARATTYMATKNIQKTTIMEDINTMALFTMHVFLTCCKGGQGIFHVSKRKIT